MQGPTVEEIRNAREGLGALVVETPVWRGKVSAGNHAMAVGYAARALGTTAKVVMPRNANPARVQGSRDYGAEVELVDDVHRAFDRVHEIEEKEGRAFIHPFEGPLTALGTGTLGLELCAQAPEVAAVMTRQ